MALSQEQGSGIAGKFVKTFAPGSSEHLAIKKLDELAIAHNALIAKFNALLVKLDADTGVIDVNYESTLEATPLAKSASDELIPSPKRQDV
jgi:hypothetical protein